MIIHNQAGFPHEHDRDCPTALPNSFRHVQQPFVLLGLSRNSAVSKKKNKSSKSHTTGRLCLFPTTRHMESNLNHWKVIRKLPQIFTADHDCGRLSRLLSLARSPNPWTCPESRLRQDISTRSHRASISKAKNGSESFG